MKSRSITLGLVLLAVALAALGVETVRLVRQTRAASLAQLDERLRLQVDELSGILRDDIDQVEANLRFVGRLLDGGDPATHLRELEAILASTRQYHLAGVYDHAGAPFLTVRDPTLGAAFGPELFTGAMAKAALAALEQPGQLASTVPVELGGGWYRAFALSLPEAPGAGPPGAVAVLVDTQALFSKLRLLTADPQSHLILLAGRGHPTPTTEPLLAAAIAELDGKRERLPGFARLVEAMRRGARGSFRLDAGEAGALGLGEAPVLAAVAPIGPPSAWSVAILRSTAKLEAHEQAIVARVGLGAAAMALLLVGFAAYLVGTARRAAVLGERLRASEQVSAIRARTERILDALPTGVMVLSPSEPGSPGAPGSGAVRVSAVNRALRDRVPEVALGAGLADAFPEASKQALKRLGGLVERARSSGRPCSSFGERVVLFAPSPSPSPSPSNEGQYNLHALPLDGQVVLVIEDLSRVRTLESQLLRAEKLATVGEIAAGVAHELGTPLGVVRGRAEILLDKLGAGHALAPGLSDIIDQIDHVARVIRQLLDFSRVSPAAVEPVELGPILDAVALLLRFEADRRNVQLAIDLCDPEAQVAADRDQLQQVLVNLVKNALDASAGGGRVLLRTCPDPAAVWDRLRIEIVDEGCGIPREHIERVFDPFFTTKKRGQGTGLGLAIVAQVVRNHGGELSLESERDRGTRVILSWPLAPAAGTAREQHGLV